MKKKTKDVIIKTKLFGNIVKAGNSKIKKTKDKDGTYITFKDTNDNTITIRNHGLKNESTFMDEPDDQGFIFVEVKGNKCIVVFPVLPGEQGNIDWNFGFVAVLSMEGIKFNDVNVKNLNVTTVEYDKKYTKKIKDMHKKYLSHQIQVDAKEMSWEMAQAVNHILEKDSE